MQNVNTKQPRDKMVLYPSMNITGMPYVKGDTVYIGYNEEIQYENEEYANELFEKIIKMYEGA